MSQRLVYYASSDERHVAATCAMCCSRRSTRSGRIAWHPAYYQTVQTEPKVEPKMQSPDVSTCFASGDIVKFVPTTDHKDANTVGIVCNANTPTGHIIIEHPSFVAKSYRGDTPSRFGCQRGQRHRRQVNPDELKLLCKKSNNPPMHTSEIDILDVRACLLFDLALYKVPWRHIPAVAKILKAHQRRSIMAFHQLQKLHGAEKDKLKDLPWLGYVHPDRVLGPLKHAYNRGWVGDHELVQLEKFFTDAYHRLNDKLTLRDKLLCKKSKSTTSSTIDRLFEKRQ